MTIPGVPNASTPGTGRPGGCSPAEEARRSTRPSTVRTPPRPLHHLRRRSEHEAVVVSPGAALCISRISRKEFAPVRHREDVNNIEKVGNRQVRVIRAELNKLPGAFQRLSKPTGPCGLSV